MFTIPGTENLSPAVKYVIAFAIIFLLLALFALILRRLTGGRLAVSQERGRARQPRLGIVDVYDLDRQRQLILLRRDNVEHLLLVGGPNDVVVETNIVRVAGARLPTVPAATETETAAPGRPAEIAPSRPVVDGGLGRLSDRTIASSSEAGAVLEPVLKPTRVTPAPSVAPPATTSRPATGRAAPAREPDTAPSPIPDMTRELEATLRQAQPPARPAPVRTEPPKTQAPAPAPVKAEPPPPPPRPEPPKVDRPNPVTPPPAPVPPRPAATEPRPPAPNPVAPPPPPPPPAPRPAAPPNPPPRTDPVPPPPPPPPPPAPPVEVRKEPAPPPPPVAPAPPKAEAKPDPFSLEDIEAEFARLLGRPLDRKE